MFDAITKWLENPLAENSNANEDDVLKTKINLQKLDSYIPQKEAGETITNLSKIPNKNLFDGIEKVQKENNLKVDRVMKPGGETETAINYKRKYGNDVDINLAKEMERDSKYHNALLKTSETEGGYSNRRNDRGKETNFGITKRWYPNEDIQNLRKERSDYLLYRDYYKNTNIYKLPDGIRDKVFDNAVNQGQPTAIMNLQKSIGVKVDGILGPITLEKLKSSNINETNNKFIGNVKRVYGEIIERYPNQVENKNGWMNRVNKY